jgi:hypothetical protein
VNHRTRTTLLAGMVSSAVLLLTACSADDPFAGRELSISGPEDGALYNADRLSEVSLEVRAQVAADTEEGADTDAVLHLDDIRVLLNTEDVTDTTERPGETQLSWTPGELEDGAYQLAVVRVPLPDPRRWTTLTARWWTSTPRVPSRTVRTPGRSCSRCGPSRST